MNNRSHTEHGDWEIARAGEILRCTVGSHVHGIEIEGTDDYDEMGIYIEPPECVIGLAADAPSYTWRTQPEGARSGPGDTDLVMHSLRKYLALAVKGNPTALLPLFAPERELITCTPLGRDLRGMAGEFLSVRAVERFLGYMGAQRDRMMGEGKTNRVPSRPELVERHGWDVKYGSHALRLAYQGREIAYRAHLTLPMPLEERDRVLAVKRGEVTQADVAKEIDHVASHIRSLIEYCETPLPQSPDWERLSQWSVEAHREHWGWEEPE